MISLIEGICDGTVDMIATDHAPHSEEEKGSGPRYSLNGITGLECAFPLHRAGGNQEKYRLKPLIEKSALFRKRFTLPGDEGIRVGGRADIMQPLTWNLSMK